MSRCVVIVEDDPDIADLLGLYRRREGRQAVVATDGARALDDISDLPYVFERMYVTQSVPRRAEMSSGLGLAIVRALVERMGATVTAARVAPEGGDRWRTKLELAHQCLTGDSIVRQFRWAGVRWAGVRWAGVRWAGR